MAHNHDIIPWHFLAENFEPAFTLQDQIKPQDPNAYPPKPGLKPRGLIGQNEALEKFIQKFFAAIKNAARVERSRYAVKYERPRNEDVVISDQVAQKIAPIIREWRPHFEMHRRTLPDENRSKYKSSTSQSDEADDVPKGGDTQIEGSCNGGTKTHLLGKFKATFAWNSLCDHVHNWGIMKCDCALPFTERTASAFLEDNLDSCYRYCILNYDAQTYYNMQVMCTLLLAGELEPLLRMATRDDTNFEAWYIPGQCQCLQNSFKWIDICELAFQSYITLNLFYGFPELWPSNHSTDKLCTAMGGSSQTELRSLELDYRRTRLYQNTLTRCDEDHPFFNVHKDMYGDRRWRQGDEGKHPRVYLATSFTEFLQSNPMEDKGHPGVGESQATELLPYDVVDAVQEVCIQHRLPLEVCSTILEFVLTGNQRRTTVAVPYDPLHPDNHAELMKYMQSCWHFIVRCEVMSQEGAFDIDWADSIGLTPSSSGIISLLR